jgi:hypothetical protein
LKTKGKPQPKKAPFTPDGYPVTVGWMGLTLHAPEGWSPVALSGEGERGHLKVTSPDTLCLEVKWERPKGTVSVPAALERYFDRLRRAARKSRQELTIRERPKALGNLRPHDQAPIPYSWEADRRAVGCIWHCGVCNRLVIAEVAGERGDDLSVAAEILKGIRDHGEGGWNSWALYGLAVELPEAYRVEKQSLVTGHQRLLLRDRGSTVQADRWGLAEIALRGVSLREWYEAREGGALARYACRVEETDLHGHRALYYRGRSRALFALLKLLRLPATFTWPRFFTRGYVWHCPQSNRIHAVFGEQPRRSGLIEEVVRRRCCH